MRFDADQQFQAVVIRGGAVHRRVRDHRHVRVERNPRPGARGDIVLAAMSWSPRDGVCRGGSNWRRKGKRANPHDLEHGASELSWSDSNQWSPASPHGRGRPDDRAPSVGRRRAPSPRTLSPHLRDLFRSGPLSTSRSATGVRLPQSDRSGRQTRAAIQPETGPDPALVLPTAAWRPSPNRGGFPRGAGRRGRARRGAAGDGGGWPARRRCRARSRLADRQSSSRRVIRVIRLPSSSTSTSNSMGLQQTGQSSM